MSLTWTVLGISGLGVYGVFIEPYHIEVHHLWIESSFLGKILEGKTAVHLSNLYMSRIGILSFLLETTYHGRETISLL